MVKRKREPAAEADDGFVYESDVAAESEPYDELDDLGELTDEDEDDDED